MEMQKSKKPCWDFPSLDRLQKLQSISRFTKKKTRATALKSLSMKNVFGLSIKNKHRENSAWKKSSLHKQTLPPNTY